MFLLAKLSQWSRFRFGRPISPSLVGQNKRWPFSNENSWDNKPERTIRWDNCRSCLDNALEQFKLTPPCMRLASDTRLTVLSVSRQCRQTHNPSARPVQLPTRPGNDRMDNPIPKRLYWRLPASDTTSFVSEISLSTSSKYLSRAVTMSKTNGQRVAVLKVCEIGRGCC